MIETAEQLAAMLEDVDAGMETLPDGHTWHMSIRGSKFTAPQLDAAAAGLKFCDWKRDELGAPLRVQVKTTTEFSVWLVRK